MATLNIKITAPLTAFSAYADQLGYQSKLVEISKSEEPIISDNPQSKQEFLAESIKGIVAVALAERASASIKRNKLQEAETESNTQLEQIKSAITISFN